VGVFLITFVGLGVDVGMIVGEFEIVTKEG